MIHVKMSNTTVGGSMFYIYSYILINNRLKGALPIQTVHCKHSRREAESLPELLARPRVLIHHFLNEPAAIKLWLPRGNIMRGKFILELFDVFHGGVTALLLVICESCTSV